MSVIQDILGRRELLYNLVLRNLKSRYKDSVLGFLWSVLVPLFMAFIYVVFLYILARGVPISEILIGVFAWQFTAQCVMNGMGSITENASLIKKVSFPRLILPLAATLSNLVNYLLNLVVQFGIVAVILAFQHERIPFQALAVPLVIAYHTLFCFALALFMASLNVFYRDMQHLIGVVMTAWFFVSPVMYSMSMVASLTDKFHSPLPMNLYLLNPMAVIIFAYRALILPETTFPVTGFVLAALLWPLLFFVLAYVIFKKLERLFADVL
ncbi:MAG: ABC transporter permease [Lentisphaerae bacterium]|nr:ABC transporter permease [Lentisphaerota bacterium]